MEPSRPWFDAGRNLPHRGKRPIVLRGLPRAVRGFQAHDRVFCMTHRAVALLRLAEVQPELENHRAFFGCPCPFKLGQNLLEFWAGFGRLASGF